MSRIGKKPIEIPSGVEITIDGCKVTAKGPLGTETVTVRPEIAVKVEDNHIYALEEKEEDNLILEEYIYTIKRDKAEKELINTYEVEKEK